ncbi:MAG TPA: TolC family protein [Candidatus Limnocylindrales bacterium]|nr:TolC family protein [Candidatus Limnocylindrales bacterium]
MKQVKLLVFASLLSAPFAAAQQSPAPAAPSSSAPASASRISLDDAIRLALLHNHALQAVRSTIQQSLAEEITANLRPNPTLGLDAQFMPIFQPDKLDADYLDQSAQFDAGIGYLFERGRKRQHRLQAAKDQTAVVRSLVTDNERQLVFNVSQQFVDVLLAESTLEFAQQDLDSFQKTVDISEERFRAGDMSEGDFLKIKLQLLQFQSDVSAAKLAKLQSLAALRQLLGFETVPDDYDVEGTLDYQPVHADLNGLKNVAALNRPDLRAAQQSVTAAESQFSLQKANGKMDITGTFNYSHTAGASSGSFFYSMPLPIFNRNQGEIARAQYAITQAREQASETTQQVATDVATAFANLQTNDQIIQLYQGGYVDQAKQSRDISEYAYRKGAASLLDYLDSERTYRANQLAYRQALASYMLALEQMRQATGTRNLP